MGTFKENGEFKGKEKTVNIGLTEDTINYFKEMTEKTFEKMNKDEEKERIGTEIKKVVVEIATREVEKIDEKLKKDNIKHDDWLRCIEDLDKITDLIRWM